MLFGEFESTLEQIATGFQFTEGPVWHKDGYLLFSDIPTNKIFKWSPENGVEVFRAPSENSNGLTFDKQWRLIACEQDNRRVSRTEKNGEIISLADSYQGKRLNSPNDVVVKSHGAIYFTDPPYGVEPHQRELDFSGVYRIDPEDKISLLVDDFDSPNGLAFSPDEKVLYIDDTTRRHVRAFDVRSDGTLENGRVFAEMKSDKPEGPDGMKVDVKGNVYVTGPGGTWVFDSSVKHIDIIVTPEPPANCAFGGKQKKTLFITARSSVHRMQVANPGL